MEQREGSPLIGGRAQYLLRLGLPTPGPQSKRAVMQSDRAISSPVLGASYALRANGSAWGHETSGKVSNPGLASR